MQSQPDALNPTVLTTHKIRNARQFTYTVQLWQSLPDSAQDVGSVSWRCCPGELLESAVGRAIRGNSDFAATVFCCQLLPYGFVGLVALAMAHQQAVLESVTVCQHVRPVRSFILTCICVKASWHSDSASFVESWCNAAIWCKRWSFHQELMQSPSLHRFDKAAETLKCKLCWQSKCWATQQLMESSFLTFGNACKMMDVHQRIFLTQWYFLMAFFLCLNIHIGLFLTFSTIVQ